MQGAIPTRSHNLLRLATPPGSASPTLLNSGVGSFTSHKSRSVKCCETGPTVFRPCPRRLESLTICRCHMQMSLQRQHFLLSYLKTLRCWSGRDLSQRPPARQTGALPQWANQAAVRQRWHEASQAAKPARYAVTQAMKRLTPGDGRELGIVRASEPCERKIEKIVIRKKVNRKLTVLNERLTPKSP